MKRVQSIKTKERGTEKPETTAKWVGDLEPGDLIVSIARPSEELGAMSELGTMFEVTLGVPAKIVAAQEESEKHVMKYELSIGGWDQWVCTKDGKTVYSEDEAADHIAIARDYS